MFDKVKEIIVEQLGIDEDKVTPEATLVDDLGADSLDVVELIMAFSDEFGFDFPDDAAVYIYYVNDVVNYLKENA